MKKQFGFIILISFLLFAVPDCKPQKESIDRKPAVAGAFYPGGKDDLQQTLRALFAGARPKQVQDTLLAVIAPHAGYVFSGEVAASAFNQIDSEHTYDNIFVIGSSHRIAFEGASVYTQGDFLTPLGAVTVNRDVGERLISEHKIFSNRMDAHITEHSLEVQLPFLQYHLRKAFRVVPVVIGAQNPETCRAIARALKPYFNSRNLFVISTDFSHYPSYASARKTDSASAKILCANSSETMMRWMKDLENHQIPNLATGLCGWSSVLTLMYLTETDSAISYRMIQYKNSGDSEYGDTSRCVGYWALAVSKTINREKTNTMDFKLTDQEKKNLLRIARLTIEKYVTDKSVPAIDTSWLTEALKTKCGAFVTLHKHQQLRGCIGRFGAEEPLYKVVQEMAIAAATQDYRFTPVTPDEVKNLEVEISVLTPMRKVQSADDVELGKHGIYIKKGFRGGTFLPQVATETGWTKEEFLGYCSRDKAGLGWDGWKDAELYVYEALVFNEADWAKE